MKTPYILTFAIALATAAPLALAAPFLYTGSPASKVDTNPATVLSLTVPDTGGILFLNLSINIGAPYADDVSIFLFHGGTLVQVYDGIGDTAVSAINATFDDGAPAHYPASGSAAGTFRPLQALSSFNGMPINGTWELRLLDKIAPGDGTPLVSWSLSGVTDSPVPEPGSMGLMGAGLAALGALRKRRANARNPGGRNVGLDRASRV